MSRSLIGVIPPGSSETLRFSAVRTRNLRDHEPGPGRAKHEPGPGRAGHEPGPGRGHRPGPGHGPTAGRSDRKPRITGTTSPASLHQSRTPSTGPTEPTWSVWGIGAGRPQGAGCKRSAHLPSPSLRELTLTKTLAPLHDTLAVTDPDTFRQLRLDLAVVVSAEALFTLTDLCGLTHEQAIISAARTARTLTTSAMATTAG